MKSTSAWVLASLLIVACGGDDTTTGGGGSTPTGSGGNSTGAAGTTSGTAGTSSTTGTGGDMGGGAGTSSAGGSGGTTGAGGAVGAGGGGGAGGGANLPADEMLCGDVQIMAAKVIAAGKVTSICAGATVTIGAKVSITINGTLRVDGTMAMPVKFQGSVHGSSAWTGIVIAQGGSLNMTYGEIRDATTPIDALKGSSYTVNHIVIENSNVMLHLAADGTIDHGVMHGLSNAQMIDPITVDSASPHISNTSVDKGVKDHIQVNGATSAPVFDHLDLTGSHCAFHFNAGNGITISNSNIHGNAYGMMVEGSSNNKITHNNFTANNPNIGDCGTGSSATVSDNYFQGPAFAPNCSKLMSTTPATAAYPTTGAGAVGPQP